MKFELGEVLKDKVTGFRGVAMGRTEYLVGCVHYGLCPQKLKDGKLPDWQWFDEGQLVSIKGTKKIVKESSEILGGPQQSAPQA